MPGIALAHSLDQSRAPYLRSGLAVAAGIALGIAGGLALAALLATRLLAFQVLTVNSDSMSPAIESGDVIIVRPANIADSRAGDLVLFSSGGDKIPTVHRVHGVNEIETRFTDRATGSVTTSTEYRLVTKGDNNPAPDSQEVTADNLRGEVWFTVPHAGAVLGLPLRAALLGVFGAVCVAWVLYEAARRLRGRVAEVPS